MDDNYHLLQIDQNKILMMIVVYIEKFARKNKRLDFLEIIDRFTQFI